jgi:hypothetical protein
MRHRVDVIYLLEITDIFGHSTGQGGRGSCVNWRDWGLLQFFGAMGFQRGDMINLELKI